MLIRKSVCSQLYEELKKQRNEGKSNLVERLSLIRITNPFTILNSSVSASKHVTDDIDHEPSTSNSEIAMESHPVKM